MKQVLDKIQFESRIEIDEVVECLHTFLEEHPDASGKETVRELSDLLDVMYMEW